MTPTSDDIRFFRRVARFLCSRRGAAVARGAIILCSIVLISGSAALVIGWQFVGRPLLDRVEKSEALLTETHDQVFRIGIKMTAEADTLENLGHRTTTNEQSINEVREAEFRDRGDILNLQHSTVKVK